MRRRMPRRLSQQRRMTRARARIGRTLPRRHPGVWWAAGYERLGHLRSGEVVAAVVRGDDAEGRTLLRILGADVWAESACILQTGDRVLLEVEAVSPVTVVRLIGGPDEGRWSWGSPVVV